MKLKQKAVKLVLALVLACKWDRAARFMMLGHAVVYIRVAVIFLHADNTDALRTASPASTP